MGVDELRQTMSRISQGDDNNKVKETSFRSEVTLAAGDGPFDFEKCLRNFVKKYIPFNLFFCKATLTSATIGVTRPNTRPVSLG